MPTRKLGGKKIRIFSDIFSASIFPQKDCLSVKFYLRRSFFLPDFYLRNSCQILSQILLLAVRFLPQNPLTLCQILPQGPLASVRFYLSMFIFLSDLTPEGSSFCQILPRTSYVQSDFTSEPPNFCQILRRNPWVSVCQNLPQNPLVSLRFYLPMFIFLSHNTSGMRPAPPTSPSLLDFASVYQLYFN